MREFNLEEALAGKPVVTRDGTKISEIHYFKTMEIHEYQLLAILEGRIEYFLKNGKYYDGCENENDLFMVDDEIKNKPCSICKTPHPDLHMEDCKNNTINGENIKVFDCKCTCHQTGIKFIYTVHPARLCCECSELKQVRSETLALCEHHRPIKFGCVRCDKKSLIERIKALEYNQKFQIDQNEHDVKGLIKLIEDLKDIASDISHLDLRIKEHEKESTKTINLFHERFKSLENLLELHFKNHNKIDMNN